MEGWATRVATRRGQSRRLNGPIDFGFCYKLSKGLDASNHSGTSGIEMTAHT